VLSSESVKSIGTRRGKSGGVASKRYEVGLIRGAGRLAWVASGGETFWTGEAESLRGARLIKASKAQVIGDSSLRAEWLAAAHFSLCNPNDRERGKVGSYPSLRVQPLSSSEAGRTFMEGSLVDAARG
jgi:hypothetical protein